MEVKNKTDNISIAEAVRNGLLNERKTLPSWLFYDKRGDELFREIMELPEYYLTKCETEIINRYSDAIAHNLKDVSKAWDVIELGAGDGTKTQILLDSFVKYKITTDYYPVDISTNALEVLRTNIKSHSEYLSIHPINSDFLEGVRMVPRSGKPQLIMFMGANIGNFEVEDAAVFLRKISSQLTGDDQIVIGFDLMKSPSVIEKAYNDYTGVTALFNKNLLIRINNELNANFDLTQFEHWPIYDAVTGACKSYLVSLRNQTVFIGALNVRVHFKAWETIYTEVSQKYSEDMIRELAGVSNLEVKRMLFDDRRYFALTFLRRGTTN